MILWGNNVKFAKWTAAYDEKLTNPDSGGALSFSFLSTYQWWSFVFQLFVDLQVVER
jgi:hypothetical protein